MTTGVTFMGQRFETREAMARAYPAFASDSAWAAVKAGCSTVLEVEQFCWERKQGWMKKVRAGARKVSGTPPKAKRKPAKKARRKSA